LVAGGKVFLQFEPRPCMIITGALRDHAPGIPLVPQRGRKRRRGHGNPVKPQKAKLLKDSDAKLEGLRRETAMSASCREQG